MSIEIVNICLRVTLTNIVCQPQSLLWLIPNSIIIWNSSAIVIDHQRNISSDIFIQCQLTHQDGKGSSILLKLSSLTTLHSKHWYFFCPLNNLQFNFVNWDCKFTNFFLLSSFRKEFTWTRDLLQKELNNVKNRRWISL